MKRNEATELLILLIASLDAGLVFLNVHILFEFLYNIG